MRRAETRRDLRLHELPLVVFTALATAGAGIGVAQLLTSLLLGSPWVPSRTALGLMAGMTAAGLLVSLRHLGRPLRGSRALSRLGGSSLSNEVGLVSLLAVTASLAVALPGNWPGRDVLVLTALLCSPLTLVALGWVYRLPGQLTWRSPAAVAQPLASGSAFGLLLLRAVQSGATAAMASPLAVGALLLEALLFLARGRSLGRLAARGEASHPGIMARRRGLLWLRISASNLVPCLATIVGHPSVAVLSMGIGLLLDRLLFYGLAVKASTEGEVARVERMLRGLSAETVPEVPRGGHRRVP